MIVGMERILKKAKEGKYGVGAFNAYNLESAQALFEAFSETRSPGIILVTGPEVQEMAAIIRSLSKKYEDIPVSVVLDHAKKYASAVCAVRAGFTDVMFDGSSLPLEENIRLTKEVADMAHAAGCGCEGELGYVGQGAKDDVKERQKYFTRPDECMRFVEETGVDFLAVAIGTAHGLYKKGGPGLALDLLRELVWAAGIPLVLHGGSDTPLEDIQAAIRIGIQKINIATDLRIAYLEGLKGSLKEDPDAIDPRPLLKKAKAPMKDAAVRKICAFGSYGKI